MVNSTVDAPAGDETNKEENNPLEEPRGRLDTAYLRSLFLAIYPEGGRENPSRDMMEGRINDAKEGRAGAGKRGAYERAVVELAAAGRAAPGVRGWLLAEF